MKKIILIMPIFLSTTLLCMENSTDCKREPTKVNKCPTVISIRKAYSSLSPAEIMNLDEAEEDKEYVLIPCFVKPLYTGYTFKKWSELSPIEIMNVDEPLETQDGAWIAYKTFTPPETLSGSSEASHATQHDNTLLCRLLGNDPIVPLTLISLIACSIICHMYSAQ